MSANISNVVNVALIEGGALAAADNPNVVAIMTSQQSGPLSSAVRYQTYADAAAVAADFGTASKMNDFALSFFGTQPNPTNAGGYLVAGYWRGASEDVAATAAKLAGAQVSESTVVAALQSVADGAMVITIDDSLDATSLIGLDFQSETDLAGIVGIIDTALTTATASVVDGAVIITSNTTGAASTITFVTDGGTGTFIGDILALTDGSGAVLTQGAALVTLAVETKLEGMTELLAAVKIRGAMFIDNPTDTESKALAEWGQANDVLQYDVFADPTNLDVDPANVVWSIKLASLTNYRMLYSASGNRKMAASYMARTHTVNFNAENSALTMQLKELSVPAEEYSQTDLNAAKRVGLDVYTTIKMTPCILTSGINDFADNRYNLIAFQDALETDFYNLLKLTGTKISQTRRGVNQLLDQAEKTTRQYVRAGVYAPGTWSSPDYFGDRDTFEQNISDNGFYWIAGKLADQPQNDREARKSPVLQGAVKMAGAVHSIDLIVNVNK
jgi:hypothetical protein